MIPKECADIISNRLALQDDTIRYSNCVINVKDFIEALNERICNEIIMMSSV